jgi:hypothetical protein
MSLRRKEWLDAMTAAMDGGKLSAKSARKLEEDVNARPNDLTERSKLLGYYFHRCHSFEKARVSRQQHLLWLIRNHPEAPILRTAFAILDPDLDGAAYEEGKKAWLEQVARRPKNTSILGGAAGYLLVYDAATAERLYKRAEAAAPRNHEWPEHLGRLYEMKLASKRGTDRVEIAMDSMDAYERSLQRINDDQQREAVLCRVAIVAFEAGEVVKADDYAIRLLRQAEDLGRGHWNYGNMLHHGRLVRGRIALLKGDIVQAKAHLLAAADTPGSPQLNSFGPNMTLAKELLESGERQVVLEYFKRCGNFWKEGVLDFWSSEVREGRAPDFGANLYY